MSTSRFPARPSRTRFAVACALAFTIAYAAVPEDESRYWSSAELERRTRLRPERAADLFTAAQWNAARKREPQEKPDYLMRIFESHFQNEKGIIPLDLKLLDRVSFVGMSVGEVQEILGPPGYPTNQPYGSLHYGMWPPVRDCHQPALILTFEPGDDFVPRIVSETVGRGVVLCVE